MKIEIGKLVFSEMLTGLRNIDAFTVSRYRIAMRSGAVFPRPIINAKTNEIVSGNHTVTAMLAEYGPEHVIEVDAKNYKTEIEIIEDFTRHNVGHGRPLDGWTQRKIAIALTEAGQSDDSVAKLLNVPVAHLHKWGERTVVVLGKDKQREVKPIKGGVFVPKGVMTARQYEKHADADIGMTVTALAEQLIMRIQEGWINESDNTEREALMTLHELMHGL